MSAPDRLTAAINEAVAAFPPLTDAQLHRVAALLSPAANGGGAR